MGSAMAGAYLVPGSAERAVDMLWFFMIIISLFVTKSSLPHPFLGCGLSEFGKAHGNHPVKEVEILSSWSWSFSLW